ncbi:tetratricopeptide repeat protein 9C-like [Palaemon carinicauda]|uniref:tetratricopeptide repeat protein 9C-like n=1 Tax=Palaemon carinicauda TaxID=392227 RepID=UPI0035B65B86
MDPHENLHVTKESMMNKLARAKEYKDKGNSHFKQQQVSKAIQSYHSGLMYIKGIEQDTNPNRLFGQSQAPTVSDEVKEEISGITADLYNNLAACLLKQQPVRYERVVECCKEVTILKPDNVKGWYRLGLAYFHLRDFDSAQEALKEANKISDGQDMAVKRLIASVDQELKKENKKFSDMFRNSLLVKQT